MDEKSFLEQLSPVDYTEFPGMDPERDALVVRLKARGFVTENIIGGVRITPAGLEYLSALSAREQQFKQPEQKATQHGTEEDRQNIVPKRRLDPVLKRLLDVLVAVVATLVAYWIMRRLGWV